MILFYFASPAGHVAGRASLIAYFMLTDLIGLAFLGREALITWNSLYLALLFLPALILGIWIGARSFKSADPTSLPQMGADTACRRWPSSRQAKGLPPYWRS